MGDLWSLGAVAASFGFYCCQWSVVGGARTGRMFVYGTGQKNGVVSVTSHTQINNSLLEPEDLLWDGTVAEAEQEQREMFLTL